MVRRAPNWLITTPPAADGQSFVDQKASPHQIRALFFSFRSTMMRNARAARRKCLIRLCTLMAH